MNDETIYAIRRMFDSGTRPMLIAQVWGISERHAKAIGERQRYKNVPEEDETDQGPGCYPTHQPLRVVSKALR